MCERKRKFQLKAKAAKAAKRFNGTCYKCPNCGWFHVTSQPKQKTPEEFADYIEKLLNTPR